MSLKLIWSDNSSGFVVGGEDQLNDRRSTIVFSVSKLLDPPLGTPFLL